MNSADIAAKYQKTYFMPPEVTYDWVKKDSITKPPIWCSVDLRDGNQALIDPMSLEDKLEFFKMLVKIGFKEIEVGFPASSDTEYNFIRALIERDMIPEDVTIQVLTQAREHIIRKTFEAVKGAPHAVIHLYNSTSVEQREQVFKKDKESIKKLAVDGATMIQIRDKDILSTDSDAGLKDEYNEALEIKRICHEHKVPLIINDNVQFAIDIDADGVHLGQDDMNPAEARKLLGTDKIIGVTAKTVEQAKKAEADGADYLGSGAVFGSTTKLNAKPMTKELLREITEAVDIPVVAIGGINADNAVTLKGTGIAGIAVVGAIFASADIRAAARELAEICDKIL